ncbi:cupin domain-containing protein [Vibrio mangrovi]|uniref:Cupin domain protein n=1 Tax=Vibrio mangrovi TaxID=474394 RepID=A0A1Y6IX51_9VIBR|nr:cupin domain-containing protein [Vibrio mangrovi]MDW6002246.1 cupin domain-containing protein [Vibrio mangrovi]SMS01591.1 Cupin domain protein [Vibrio mangrovi]
MGVKVIERVNIPTISHVNINGELHYIGNVQPLNNNPEFREFINNIGNGSGISYVKLNPGETHNIHTHDVESLLIVTKGKARLLGKNIIVSENNIICIPRGTEHGFSCDQNSGLEGISIQFEDGALFENTPNITFNVKFDSANQLICFNKKRCKEIQGSRFFKIFDDGVVNNNYSLTVFKIYLRQWSSIFQKIMFMRQASSINKKYDDIFLEHFKEEFGHDEMLPESNNWDPAIDAYGNWFVLKMLQMDNLEKLVVVHLVLEKCADVFHSHAKKYIKDTEKYIESHAELDHNHSEIGRELYENLSEEKCLELIDLCDKSWAIFESLLDRIAELSINKIESNNVSDKISSLKNISI